MLGRPFMPWQQDAVDVGCEVLEDGRWAYKTIVITVMRQVGKTTTVEAVITHRGQMLSEETLWMTAQNGKKARARWLAMTDRLVRRLPRSFKRNIGVSHELLRWVKSGSQLYPFAPGGDGEDMHGETPALVSADEIWVFTAAEWALLQQSYIPGMITKNAQEWISSTQGTDDSEALNDLVEAGRALVERQMVDESARRGMCYIEYSIPPELDGVPVEQLTDEQLLDLICEHNPSIGYTQTREDLADHLTTFVRAGNREGFIRGYGNHRMGSHKPRLIPVGTWRSARTELTLPEGRPGIGIAVDELGANVAVVAGGRLESGQAVVEVIQTGPGWLLELEGELVDPASFVKALAGRHKLGAVCVGTSGANRDLADHLEAAGVEIARVNPADYAAACTRTRKGFESLTVLHRGQPSLDLAAKVAGQRKVAGGLGWAAPSPDEPVAALDAASLAVWAADHPIAQPGDEWIF